MLFYSCFNIKWRNRSRKCLISPLTKCSISPLALISWNRISGEIRHFYDESQHRFLVLFLLPRFMKYFFSSKVHFLQNGRLFSFTILCGTFYFQRRVIFNLTRPDNIVTWIYFIFYSKQFVLFFFSFVVVSQMEVSLSIPNSNLNANNMSDSSPRISISINRIKIYFPGLPDIFVDDKSIR